VGQLSSLFFLLPLLLSSQGRGNYAKQINKSSRNDYTCSVHRPRENSHAVELRCIAAELWKAAKKKKPLSCLARNTAYLSTQVSHYFIIVIIIIIFLLGLRKFLHSRNCENITETTDTVRSYYYYFFFLPTVPSFPRAKNLC